MPAVVVIVEDDTQQRDEAVLSLQLAGLAAFGAPNGATLNQLMAAQTVDVVVLDVGLPGESGLSIARRLAALPHPPGIVMLTALGDLDDRLRGMGQGSDAYMVKPVDPRELIATIEALRRRMKKSADSALVAKSTTTGWVLSSGGRQLTLNRTHQAIQLTELQRLLLSCFKDVPTGQPVSRDDLMDVLGYGGPDGDYHRLETLVSRLRQKVRDQFNEDLPLRAVPNQGYAMMSGVMFV
jgi:two-component system, OmpR family, response regulator PhoP